MSRRKIELTYQQKFAIRAAAAGRSLWNPELQDEVFYESPWGGDYPECLTHEDPYEEELISEAVDAYCAHLEAHRPTAAWLEAYRERARARRLRFQLVAQQEIPGEVQALVDRIEFDLHRGPS